ncbi:MAG: PadR family transcriptional regulator [Acidobacteria bacterium]|nr:PadR family transcriptional regulator [Acidobacteriota bacterium]
MPPIDRETRQPIPPGTLDMLILQTLARHGEMHGFEIADSIQQLSAEVLQVEEGSLYPALQRMLLKGWLKAEWGKTSGNRRARYYRLSPAGRGRLDEEIAQYRCVSQAIGRILQPV